MLIAVAGAQCTSNTSEADIAPKGNRQAVGQETVQYIGNIYKYYVAYSVLLEQRTPAAPPSATEVSTK